MWWLDTERWTSNKCPGNWKLYISKFGQLCVCVCDEEYVKRYKSGTVVKEEALGIRVLTLKQKP